MSTEKYMARPGQLLEDHLHGVGAKAKIFASKLDLGHCGELLGLLHDIGKYSQKFQVYLNSATGQLDPDADEYMDPKHYKGKIDHSTAGAQWIWRRGEANQTAGEKLVRQMMALCVASHHSGLIDCLKPCGRNSFNKRITKDCNDTSYEECLKNIDKILLQRMESLSDNLLVPEMMQKIKKLTVISGGKTNWFYY
ncbi:MAG: CRISPR-associated endonuclease Cas3'', partial [Gammaproteobacteria bacterium]|nr:CRISPR-associated endonuclease Cas3'' [Gammaproteobacteria bacterium]